MLTEANRATSTLEVGSTCLMKDSRNHMDKYTGKGPHKSAFSVSVDQKHPQKSTMVSFEQSIDPETVYGSTTSTKVKGVGLVNHSRLPSKFSIDQ